MLANGTELSAYDMEKLLLKQKNKEDILKKQKQNFYLNNKTT